MDTGQSRWESEFDQAAEQEDEDVAESENDDDDDDDVAYGVHN